MTLIVLLLILAVILFGVGITVTGLKFLLVAALIVVAVDVVIGYRGRW